MENSINNRYFEILSNEALLNTFGGKPNKDTGFWYDVAYGITISILINPRPTAWATGKIGAFR